MRIIVCRWHLAAVSLAALLSVCLAASARPDDETPAPAPYDPTDDYIPRDMEGWSVRVSERLLSDDERPLCDRTLRVLDDHLFRITRVVPEKPLARLREIPIWVERAHPLHPCMCYHPDAGWLREHGMNPEKEKAVELANAENFITWTIQQPWMVLHELAHGYHDRVLGFEHPEVLTAFEQAQAAKSYESVLRINDRTERAYALTNQMEYFAEASEAYFGTNDFFPFVRAELRQYDRGMFELLQKVWGEE